MSADPVSRREALLRELKLRELRKAAGPIAGTAPAPIALADRAAPLPLSWTQQRLWFIDQLDPEASAAYHMPSALRLRGPLDHAALKAALDRVVARHEVLRTCFPSVDGQPVQRIGPAEAGLTLLEHDLSGLAEPERAQALARLVAEEAQAAFDLAAGPPMRGRLLRLGEHEHALLLTQHHIVSDGWSVGLLIGEISTLYRAFSQGQDDPLPPLQVQFADYAVWQRTRVGGEGMRASLAYWKQRLAGAPELLELPLDRPRAPLRDHAGGEVSLTLAPALAGALRRWAQAQGATAFMVLLAGWALLLSRLSGQDDVVVGTPIANRSRREFEPLLGFFANTLALRTHLSPQWSGTELLQRVKADTLAAYEHQDTPFEEVVEALNPRRNTAYSPVFQTVLAFNNTPREAALALPGMEVGPLQSPVARTPFDLGLSLAEREDGAILAHLRYATALWNETTARRWLDHYSTLLDAMTAAPERAIGELPLEDGQAALARLRAFNPGAAPQRIDDRIDAALARAAAATPEAVALIDGERELSFGALDRLANGVAQRLTELGVRRGDRVALCIERSAEQVIGLFGALKAGAAYVPLEPGQPSERLEWLLRDCRPAAVLTGAATRAQLPATGTPTLDPADAVAQERPPVPAGASEGDAAYVIYTSGSTGRPKGVVVEHGAILSLWAALREGAYTALPAHAHVALNASFSFDASLTAILQCLSGHALVVVPAAIRADAAALSAFLRERRIDLIDCTPAQVQALLDADPVPYPRLLMVGGEAIPPALWRRLASLPDTRAYNVYGPTECSVCATMAPIQGEVATIGTPLANTRIYVLDAQGRPLPPGVVGEIHIGGAGVARGYLDRAELTAQRFLADPFAGVGGARMYRSGDLGYWRDDGRIAYVGRNDFQVKLRGYRIELGEIESRLAELDGVGEAIVLARADDGEARLVAYLRAEADALPSPAELRQRLAATLPDYMLPSAFVTLPAWPLTANGKVDRAALPAPDASAWNHAEGFLAPADATEERLARIWSELLRIEHIGRNDNFFDLGGHSLLATQLAIRIEREFGVAIALMQIFQTANLAELGAAVAAAPCADAAPVKGAAMADGYRS